MRLLPIMIMALAALASITAASAQGLTLASNKPAYIVGDHPVFTVVSERDCHLTLVAIDAHGKGAVLFPNRFQTDNLIKAQAPFKIPGRGAAFVYRLHACGDERIFAICTLNNDAIAGIAHDFSRSIITPVEPETFLPWVAEQKSEVAEINFTVSPPPKPAESQ